jgi:hypothetical protein
MAKQEVGLKIDVDVSSVGNMKQQLRAATNELVAMNEKFGSTSKEAVAAAQKVAGLKDAIGDAKALAETFNPDKKFVALGGAVQGAAAGFSALQGAMGLFGAESKEVEQMLLKVQSAMALQQGISGIANAMDSFKLLAGQIATSSFALKANAVATNLASGAMKLFGVSVSTTSNAFRVLKGAIIATGIGALIVLAGELVNVLMDVADSSDEAAAAQKRLEKAQKDAADAIELQNEMLEGQIDLAKRNTDLAVNRAKAAGASEEEITKLTRDGILKRQKLLKDDLEQRGIGTDQFFEKLEEFSKVNNELEDFDLNQQIKRREKLDADREKRIAKDSEKAKKKKEEVEAEKKRLAELQKNTEEFLKQNAKRTKELQDQLRLSAITDEKEKAKVENQIKLQSELDAETERFKAGELRLEQYLLNLALIRQRYANDQKAKDEEDKNAELTKQSEKLLKDAENDALSFEERLAKIQERQALENQIVFASEEDRKKFIAENEKAITDIKLLEGQVRTANAQFAADQLSAIAAIAGQDTAAGKALSVAAATISTYLSAQKAYESQFKPVAIVDSPIRGAIAAGVAIATGIANVRKILSVQVPGGRGGGGGAGISTSSPVPPQLSPQVTATAVNTAAVNQMGNQATRAYVLNSDIQNNDQRNAYINRNASIGNP